MAKDSRSNRKSVSKDSDAGFKTQQETIRKAVAKWQRKISKEKGV
jgi:hypothetical protein